MFLKSSTGGVWNSNGVAQWKIGQVTNITKGKGIDLSHSQSKCTVVNTQQKAT